MLFQVHPAHADQMVQPHVCGAHLHNAVRSLQTKCVMEEINRNVLVVGDFAAFHKDNSANLVPMTVKVHMGLPPASMLHVRTEADILADPDSFLKMRHRWRIQPAACCMRRRM